MMRTQSICLALAIVLVYPFASAQWVQTQGPCGGNVTSLAVLSTNLFCGTFGGGIFRSTDNGTSWTAVNTGLTNTSVNVLAVSDTNLFAGTYGGGVFVSTNRGINWTPAGSIILNGAVYALAVSGTNLFAGLGDWGVFRSTDNGTSWIAVNSGITGRHSVVSLEVFGTNILAGTQEDGVFISTNNGTSWTEVKNGLPANAVLRDCAVSDTNLFAGTTGGVFLSTDKGASWTTVNTEFITALAVSDTTLFAGTYGGGILVSTNNGTSWVVASTGLTSSHITALAVSPSIGGTASANIFAGTNGAGVFLSADDGASWNAASTGLTYMGVNVLAISGPHLFAGTRSGVFQSADNGTSWRASSYGIPSGLGNFPPPNVLALAASGTNLVAGTGYWSEWGGYGGGGVFLSTDNGANWTGLIDGLPGIGVPDSVKFFPYISCLTSSGQNIFAGTFGGGFQSPWNGGVLRTTNNGLTWNPADSGLPHSPSYDTTRYANVFAFLVSGTNLFAGTDSGVYFSTDDGVSWNPANSGLPHDAYDTTRFADVQAFAVIGTNLFAGCKHAGVYRTTNNGTSWEIVMGGLTDSWLMSLAVDGTNLFAGTGGGVFLSTNNGTGWTAVNQGLPTAEYDPTNYDITCLASSGTNLFAGTSLHGVWRRPLSEMITSVNPAVRMVPQEFALSQNYPNPFNPSTTIKYELPKSSEVRLSVFDMLGREVSVLVNERRDAGIHEVKFDGANLASGVYFYRLYAGDFTQTKRLLLLR